jgi:hypothetical protein
MRARVIRWWIPVLGSFGVYLVPLVGPHAVWTVGTSLAVQVGEEATREPGWLVANLALALGAQGVVWLLLGWSLGGSRLRLLAWVPTLPVLVVGMNLAYLSAIPSFFLIEPDTALEITDWEEDCFVPDVSLLSVRTPATRSVAGVREWWVQRPDARYGLLRVADCVVLDAGLPVPRLQPDGRVDFMLELLFSVPGGAASLERLVPFTAERTWWVLASPSTPLVPIVPPDSMEAAPILSDAADAVAWVQRVADSGPPVLQRVVVRPFGASSSVEPLDIALAPFGPASYTLLGVDTAAREVALWRNDEPFLVGFDGTKRDTSFAPGALRPQASTYLRHRDGWVAWDAYREEGTYRLAWSLPAGSGTRHANKGRNITAAAVDPSARFIAISESTALSIGSARDVVYVIRTNDGADAFRTYLPRYARSHVVFFEGGRFAYSDLDGTHVLRVAR